MTHLKLLGVLQQSCQSAADGVRMCTAVAAVDCGGSCPACLTSRNCIVNNDCLSLSCVGGKCQEPPQCYNKVRQQQELLGCLSAVCFLHGLSVLSISATSTCMPCSSFVGLRQQHMESGEVQVSH